MASETARQDGEDESRARVFISYSRKDVAFADRLEAALKARGFEPLIDRSEIYAFEEWWKRIEVLIARADTVAFVLSSDAVASDVALREVAFAASLNKRFAPIVFRPVEEKCVPEALAKLNFIFFNDAAPFDQSANQLAEALNTDIAWIRRHTEFGEQARRWALATGPSGLLLRSPVLEEAERWIAARPRGAPAPTEETQAFIRQSRQDATRRRNILTGSLVAGLVLALALAGTAYWQRAIAIDQRRIAEEQRASADEQRNAAVEQRDRALLTQSRLLADRAAQSTNDNDPATAMLLSIEALPDVRAGIARPFAPEAQVALFSGYQQLQEFLVFGGHVDYVREASFSPDNRLVVTASVDHTARIWDSKTAGVLRVLGGHAMGVLGARFSPNGKRVITASSDQTARIWDADSGQTLTVLKGHTGIVWHAAFSPDGTLAVTASDDNTARIWELRTGQTLRVLRGHTGAVISAEFSPDGMRVVTASLDRTARVWDLEKPNAAIVFTGHSEELRSAVFSPDGDRVASGGVDENAIIWDAATGHPIQTLKHPGPIWAVQFSPDGKQLITGGDGDAKIRFWDIEDGSLLMAVGGHDRTITSLQFGRDGKTVLSGSIDGTARLWRTTQAQHLATTLRGFDYKTIQDLKNPYLNYSRDGRRLIAGSDDKTARVWDVESRKIVVVLAGHSDEVICASLSPDGSLAVTGSADKTVRIWDLSTGHTVITLEGHTAPVSSVSFSPDGTQIISSAEDGTVRVWRADSGELLSTLVIPEAPDLIFAAAFSPDMKRAVVAHRLGAEIWNLGSERLERTLTGHADLVSSVRFGSDGRTVLTGSYDKEARLWDIEKGTSIKILSGHGGRITTVDFSPDGKQVITSSLDETARIWDLASGQTTAVLPSSLIARFAPDGKHAATSGANVVVWRLFQSAQELVDEGKREVPRCLTRAQRGAFLDPEPPAWCIEMQKWPYQGQEWKDWLGFKRVNAKPPLPDTPEWQPWLTGHQ